MLSHKPTGTSLIAMIAAAGLATAALPAGSAAAQTGNGNASNQTTNVQGTANPNANTSRANTNRANGSAKGANGHNGVIVNLDSWNTAPLYKGISSNWLIGSEAHGPNGNVVGDVENIVIGPNGQIQRLIIASGGFLDIGDTNYGVPWNQVKVPSGRFDWVDVPVTQQNLSKYPTYPEVVEKVTSQNRNWQPRELIGDVVNLKGAANYGYVSDIIFNRSGKVESVVVNPSYGAVAGTRNGAAGGYYAMPFYGYGYGGWTPGATAYNAPYTRGQIEGVGAYDYGRMQAGAARGRNMGNGNMANANNRAGVTANGGNNSQAASQTNGAAGMTTGSVGNGQASPDIANGTIHPNGANGANGTTNGAGGTANATGTANSGMDNANGVLSNNGQ
ncbi:PRC-barrel domain-containing protein [Jiella sp. M17.18]|uniref:PRC-barrel domain-containing protein n=1 Tax=Jiella sp. M17.18 TaxID=3234247 RepID=UPI0034DF7937